MKALLDVNVLISLIDEQHINHRRAQTWLLDSPEVQWLSCPITQNGVVRIVSSPSYSTKWSMRHVQRSLRLLMEATDHQFVADDISLLDDRHIQLDRLVSPKQITDTYLLALAARHGATFATLDARIATDAVLSPDAEIFLIP